MVTKRTEQIETLNRFDPNEHMELIKNKPYLPVAWRIVWMRQDHPDWGIETYIDSDGKTALGTAWIKNAEGKVISMAHKRGKPRGIIADFEELAETGAVGRALAYAGYGTQFAPELAEEDGEVVDAPVTPKSSVQAPQESTEVKTGFINTPSGNMLSKAFYAKAKNLGMSADAAHDMAVKKLGLTHYSDITKEQLQALMSAMNKKIEEVKAKEIPDVDLSDLDGGL